MKPALFKKYFMFPPQNGQQAGLPICPVLLWVKGNSKGNLREQA
jgi:hypothetical protein